MKKIILLVALSLCLFAQDPIVSLENDPSTIVEGKVNVITGEPVIFQEDLIIQGAEPIRIERAYVNGVEGKWHWGVFGLLEMFDNGYLTVTEKNGTPMEYRKEGKVYIGSTKYSRYEPFNFYRGFSNTAHGKISSRTNLKNNYILLNEKSGSFEVHCADGTVRYYELDRGGHHLESERLPNGNWILYEYEEVIVDKKKDLFTYNLKSIRTTNPTKTKVYARADVQLEDPKLRNKHFYIVGSDGGSIEYQYQNGKKPHSGPLSHVLSTDFPTMRLAFVNFTHEYKQLKGNYRTMEECRLQSFIYPQNRVFRLDYYQNDTEKVAGQSIAMEDYWIGPLNPYIDPRRSRIKTLSSQVGRDEKLSVTHSFIYDLENKKTSVYEIDGTRIDYSWDHTFRLSKIERFSKEKKRLYAESYSWGTSPEDLGNLLSKTFVDESGVAISSKKYFYDGKGNIIEERFYGNLSGEKEGEFYVRNYQYSSGEPSLLIEESEGTGLRIVYEYLPDTDLVVSELTFDGEELKRRRFWEYDEDCILRREISDDGNGSDPNDFSGVKVRTLREIIPFEEGPYIGMPHILEERYWEKGCEHLLKKTVLTYGMAAQITQKDIYDAAGEFRYRLSFDYDEKGRLVKEVNPLGQIQSYKYDECGNRISVRSFSGRSVANIAYDYSNRCMEIRTQGDDGVKTSSEMSYDWKHQLISELDTRGNETKYSYDLLGHRTKTEFFDVSKEEVYDSSGNPILQIDEEGYKTETSFNAYGKPLVILYPDGARKSYTYYLNGLLKTESDPRGVTTSYQYDFLGRLIKKSRGEVEESYEYYGDRLVSKTDGNGNQTVYTYDGAGRKSSEELNGERSLYFYDSLGRVSIVCREDYLLIYEYDLLDRVIEEREERGLGNVVRKVRYEYDEGGNQKGVIRFIAAKEAQEIRRYDSLNRLIETIDPLGAKESIYYDDSFVNGDKERVLRKKVTDPLGLQTIYTFDVHNRIASTEKWKEKLLFQEEKRYDKRGLLKSQIDIIFSLGEVRKVDTRWDYDCRGRIISLIEAGEKITRYEYNLRGELERKIKPDGRVLTYEYNDLGHLVSLFSSDGSVRHSMEYDRLGQILSFDGVKRVLDAKGRVLSERFPTRYSVENWYDKAGRRIGCSIPEADCRIEYEYCSSYMTRLTRKTERKETLYSHRYLDYDLSGHSLREESIQKQPIDYTMDLLGRRTEVSSPHFSQEILRFDPVGNITQMRVLGDRMDYTYDDLYQLSSEMDLLYQFDSLNNRLQKGGERYQINALQQVVSHLQYDKNGNPVQNEDVIYTYDALDRLIRIEGPTFSKTFTYDALHRCLTETTNREKRHFIYDGQHEIGSFNEYLDLLDLRILGVTPHAEIGASVAIEVMTKVYAPIHDLQGNLAAAVPLDQSSPILFRYTAFGEERGNDTLIPWRYSSKRVDPETGLINFGRRFYLPTLGRWLTPDPSGFSDGMNLYAYVHNNPLISLDEFGLISYLQGQGWQNCPWGSPFSYSGTYLGSSFFAPPPERWNLAQVDRRLIPSLNLHYKRSPHYYVNGILNSPTDSQMGAGMLRKSLGKMANVTPIYSPSRGWFQDLKSVRAIKKGSDYDSLAVWKLKREIISSSLYMDALHDPRKLFVTAFSRGAGDVFHAVKSLTPDQKNRLIITACGPIMILPRELAFSVTNLISKGDRCSLFCNRELKRNPFHYEESATVRLLPQKDGFGKLIGDHFFLSQTYQGGIEEYTKPKYEEYGGER